VFPNVDTNEGDMGEEGILICCGDNLERLRGRVEREPAPAAPLNPSSGGVELLLERLDRTKVALDCVLESAVLEIAAAFLDRRKVLPEERVVDVTSTVKLERCL